MLSGIFTCFNKKSQRTSGQLFLKSNAEIHEDIGFIPPSLNFQSIKKRSSLLSELRIEDFKMLFGLSVSRLPTSLTGRESVLYKLIINLRFSLYTGLIGIFR